MDVIRELRKNIFLTAYKAGSAHLASSLSIVELLYVLYNEGFVTIDIDDPWKEDRDRLILSKGHACLAQYVMLNKLGAISDADLASFCQPGSHLGGEPMYKCAIGIEAATGSLGHGLSFAVGIAMAYKVKGYKGHVYVVIGDGECQEGSIWEAVMAAINFRLDNMTIILDDNKLQAMDRVENIMGITSWKDKFEAFGYCVNEVDGHNIDDILKALSRENHEGVPGCIISNTIKGRGISFMESVPIWHYRMPNVEELKVVCRELDIDEEELK